MALWQRLTLWGDLVPRDPLTATAAALTIAGTGVTAAGTLASGNSARQANYFRAAQEDMAANEARAAGQRTAMDRQRQTRLMQSQLIARAAAGGGSVTDPGVVDLAGDIAQRGEYESLLEMYKGENRARGLTDAATGDRLTGDAARRGSRYAAAGTILGGVGSALRPTRFG